MRIPVIAALLFAFVLAVPAYVFADHDKGHRKSQDDFHRKNPSNRNVVIPPQESPSVSPTGPTTQQVIAVRAPASLVLLGAGLLVGLVALRRSG